MIIYRQALCKQWQCGNWGKEIVSENEEVYGARLQLSIGTNWKHVLYTRTSCRIFQPWSKFGMEWAAHKHTIAWSSTAERLQVSVNDVSFCCWLRRTMDWSWQKRTVYIAACNVLQHYQGFNELTFDHRNTRWKPEKLQNLRLRILKFKIRVISIFDEVCKTGLHTLEFHLLDHIVKDLKWFGSL